MEQKLVAKKYRIGVDLRSASVNVAAELNARYDHALCAGQPFLTPIFQVVLYV